MKKISILFTTIAIMLFLSLQIYAYDTKQIDEKIDISSLFDSIPQDSQDLIPESFLEEENTVEKAKKIDNGFLIELLKKSTKKVFPSFSATLCSLLGVVFLTALVNSAKNNLASESFSKIISFITVSFTAISAYDLLSSITSSVSIYISALNTMINAMLPIMLMLYTIGGNVTTAVVNSSGTAFLLNIMNSIITGGLYPLIDICFGLTIAESLGNIKGLTELTRTLKNIFTAILSGTMTVLSIFLMFKTGLSATADGVSARTIKFAGSFIPVVGSALGDSVRTLMAGIGLIKNSVGFIGIIIILIISLPVVIKVIAAKLCLDLTSGAAVVLGCDKEGNLLKNLSSILGFSLAVIVCVSILFIIELTVFVIISPSLGAI